MSSESKIAASSKANVSAAQVVGPQAIQKTAVGVIQNMEAPDAEQEVGPIQRKENKTGMPDQLKSGVENLSGMSMDHVKVHYNSSQPAQLNALAYAQGSDIHIGPGQEKHLPHEAWHVVQQAQGRVQATRQMKAGVPVNDDPGLEHEADVMGEKALSSQPSVKQTKTVELQRAANVMSGAQLKGTVQRVITFTRFETGKDKFDVDVQRSPQEFADAIKTSAAYKAMAKKCLEKGIAEEDAVHRRIVEFIRISADNQIIPSRNEFLKQLERIAKTDFPKFLEGGGKAGVIEKELNNGQILFHILERVDGREALHKLALIRKVNPGIVTHVYILVEELLKKSRDLLSNDELTLLFSKLTSSQTTEDVENGIEGYVQAAEGIYGELAGLAHINPEDVAEGERIYNGSEFKDTGSEESHQQEVDISYIDKNGVLHLIEAANSLNVLKNKVLGSSGQKGNYVHLSKKAKEMEQMAPGGFNEAQAQPKAVSAVEFSYVIPTDEVDHICKNSDNYSLDYLQQLDDILRSMVLANALLRIGSGRVYTVSDLNNIKLFLLTESQTRQTKQKTVYKQLVALAATDADELSDMERFEKMMLQAESTNLIYGKNYGK